MSVDRCLHPTIECNLSFTFVFVKNHIIEGVIVTSGHLSRSSRLESSFHGKPFTPAVGRAAGNVEVLFYPRGESPVGVSEVIASALSAELFAEVVEQRSEVGLS